MYSISTKKLCIDTRVDAKTPFEVSISEIKSMNGVISNISTELATGMYYSCWKEFINEKSSDDILSVLPKNMHSKIIRFDDFGIDIERLLLRNQVSELLSSSLILSIQRKKMQLSMSSLNSISMQRILWRYC